MRGRGKRWRAGGMWALWGIAALFASLELVSARWSVVWKEPGEHAAIGASAGLGLVWWVWTSAPPRPGTPKGFTGIGVRRRATAFYLVPDRKLHGGVYLVNTTGP